MADKVDTSFTYSIDDYFQTTPLGSLDTAIGNNFYGHNHRQVAGMVPSNKDTYGYTFFVRPQLNLQSDNLRNCRQLYRLMDTTDASINRVVRCLLDPRIQDGYRISDSVYTRLNCPFVNERDPFIPIMGNNLLNISGWPDITIPTFKAPTGNYGESFTMIDGPVKLKDTITINATFRNTRGDAIIYLLYVWLYYATLAFEGKILPYPDYLSGNYIDYNTRIFRLVLDHTKRYVVKWAATGPAFPTSNPMGQFFDFNSEKPFNDQTKEFSVSFDVMGVDYMDDITIFEFNKTVAIFNPSMNSDRRETELIQIPRTLLTYFNNRGYPRINPDNYELEWWTERELFLQRTDKILANSMVDKESEKHLRQGLEKSQSA